MIRSPLKVPGFRDLDMKRAEITVFLSMVLILTVSFILGIIEITVIHTSKAMSRLETDRAVFSIFGEYQERAP